MPVSTSCARPESAASICAASRPSRGLPSAFPSRKTSVSAASTRPRPARAATSSAFLRASARTQASGSPETSSSTCAGRTENGTPMRRSSSARRGDAEANRISSISYILL